MSSHSFEVSGRAIRIPGNNERNEPCFQEKLLQSFCLQFLLLDVFLKLPASEFSLLSGSEMSRGRSGPATQGGPCDAASRVELQGKSGNG
jgi:hypothetical protein